MVVFHLQTNVYVIYDISALGLSLLSSMTLYGGLELSGSDEKRQNGREFK